MENGKNKQNGHEDEISASIKDVNKKREKAVDSFKTGNKKQGRYFDQPFDEQMHDPNTYQDDESE